MHENESSSPSHQPERPVAEQVPHSGVHHGERPVEEFDNTPLPDAVERGLVNPTPDSPAGLASAPEQPKKRNKLLIGGSIGLAGAVIAAGAVIGVKAASDGGHTAHEKDPKATSQTPEATSTPTAAPEQGLTVQSVEIPASMEAKEAVTLVSQRLAEWQMAGSTDAVHAEWQTYYFKNHGTTTPGVTGNFVDDKAAGYAAIYEQALFPADWQSSADLTWLANQKKYNNATDLEDWLLTYNTDDPVFKYWTTVESVTPGDATDTSASFTIAMTEHNNASTNRIGTKYDPGLIAQDGGKFVEQVTLKKIDGTWKLANYHVQKAS